MLPDLGCGRALGSASRSRSGEAESQRRVSGQPTFVKKTEQAATHDGFIVRLKKLVLKDTNQYFANIITRVADSAHIVNDMRTSAWVNVAIGNGLIMTVVETP